MELFRLEIGIYRRHASIGMQLFVQWLRFIKDAIGLVYEMLSIRLFDWG